MANTYYCVLSNTNNGMIPGVYCYTSESRSITNLLLKLNSEKIWQQGPKGGIKIIKDTTDTGLFGYITKNEKAMVEFMWVKLQAQPYIK